MNGKGLNQLLDTTGSMLTTVQCGACNRALAPSMIVAVYMTVPFCIECIGCLNIAGGCTYDQAAAPDARKPHEASH